MTLTNLGVQKFITVLAAIFLLGAMACSSGISSSPVSPDTVPLKENSAAESNRFLWGYYNIHYNPETNETAVIPLREGTGHWNVLKFLEQGPCTNCLKVIGTNPTGSGTIEFNVEITHPYQSLNLSGFDVRGIALFNSSFTFPVTGWKIPDGSQGDGELVNPDGYTTLYNALTLGQGPGGLQGYLKGKFASSLLPSADLNGFHRLTSTYAGNTRNAFNGGDKVTQTFEIRMPTGQFVFGYAVDASWVPPTTNPVTDPQTDFPPDANCPEPWRLDVNPTGTITTKGGSSTIWMTVYDYEGLASLVYPKVECPALWNGEKAAGLNNQGADSTTWSVTVQNEKSAPVGTYKCLVWVEDTANATSPPHLDLTAYQVIEIQVVPDDGYVRTAGGPDWDCGLQTSWDTSDSVYVCGSFKGTASDPIDFDPGPAEDIHYSVGDDDVFLSKYDLFGNHVWTVTFGGTGMDFGVDVYAIYQGSVLVCGCYHDTVDFDPGSGTANSTSTGLSDAYLASFSSDGVYEWHQTWGDVHEDIANTVTYDKFTSEIITGGYYSGSVDFDPSTGIFLRTSNGFNDGFVSKHNTTGTWINTLVLGGIAFDVVNSVAVDSSNNVYVTGYYSDWVDFDPDTPIALFGQAGLIDGFVAKYNTSLGYEWASTFGGAFLDEGKDIVLNGSIVYVGGYFQDNANFDQQGAGDMHTSLGASDSCVIAWNTSGAFMFGSAWGGAGNETVLSIAAEPGTNIYAGGFFEGTSDFDPSGNVENRVSNGLGDAFVMGLDASCNYLWCNAYGGTGEDSMYGISRGENNSLYLCGGFCDTIDFEPGPDSELHASNGTSDFYLMKLFQDGNW